MPEEIKKLIDRQKSFQRFVGFPVDSVLESVRNEMSEKYLFKMIEEVIELRKEFPSAANPWSKSQKVADIDRIKEELADVIFFLINFINVWKFTPEEIIDVLGKVQDNNFRNVKQKKMNMLDTEILNLPGSTVGLGQGNLSPKYIFIGINPSSGIEKGYRVWSDEKDGSSSVLLPILDKLGIRGYCYFTNLVKCTTVDNSEPDGVEFWTEYLKKEVEILKHDNPGCKIIAMGKWVSQNLPFPHSSIHHPSYILRGGLTANEYELEITKEIK